MHALDDTPKLLLPNLEAVEATMTETEGEMIEEAEDLQAAVEVLVVGKNVQDRETAIPVSPLLV